MMSPKLSRQKLFSGKALRFLVGAILALVVAWYAMLASVAEIWGQTNPFLPQKLGAESAGLEAKAAERLQAVASQGRQNEVIAAALGEQGATIAALARNSLRMGSLQPAALRVLAMQADDRNDHHLSRKLLQTSVDISRRDTGSLLLLAIDRLKAQDADVGIRYLDYALRTSNRMRPILFDALSQSMQDPAVQEELASLYRADPPWMFDFLTYSFDNRQNVSVISKMMRAYPPAVERNYFPALRTKAIAVLAEQAEFAELSRLYEATTPMDSGLLRTVAFTKQSVEVGSAPITWQLLESAVVVGSFEAEAPGKPLGLFISAGPGAHELVARKLLMLPPGTFRIGATISSVADAPVPVVRLVIGCKGTGGDRLLLNEPLGGSSAQGISSLRFVVPAGCEGQYLSVDVEAPSQVGDSQAMLESLRLSRD